MCMCNFTKVALDGFKWVKNTSQFYKDFTENYSEDSDEGYFLEVDFNNYLPFLPERRKTAKFRRLLANLHDQK